MTAVLQMNFAGHPVGNPVELPKRHRRLSTIVARYANKRRPFIVSVHKPGQLWRPEDHTVKMRTRWARTLVTEKDIVLITYLPRGGGGGGAAKQIGSAVALLALAIAAPYALGAIAPEIFGTFGALTTAGRLVAAGICVGGQSYVT